jgi:hypothetical protein
MASRKQASKQTSTRIRKARLQTETPTRPERKWRKPPGAGAPTVPSTSTCAKYCTLESGPSHGNSESEFARLRETRTVLWGGVRRHWRLHVMGWDGMELRAVLDLKRERGGHGLVHQLICYGTYRIHKFHFCLNSRGAPECATSPLLRGLAMCEDEPEPEPEPDPDPDPERRWPCRW